MKRLKVVAASALVFALAAHASKKAPPLDDLSKYPAQETHAKEKVTVAVDPFDTRTKADFFRINYVGHGFLPVRVIFRNDGDLPVSLNEVRIQLVPKRGDRIPAALPSEINRRLFRIKDTQAKHIPGVPIVTYHKAPVDKKIVQDQDEFGFKSTTVAPHSTLDGFLIYDINNLDDDDGLQGASIYIKEAKTTGAGGAELFPFDISLDKYLDSKPKTIDEKKK